LVVVVRPPWNEATSRQLVALVSVGHRYFDYYKPSIFGVTSEHRPVARAILATESRQTWGNIDASLRYTRFLHNASTYSVSFSGRTNIRLSRGLSLELRGDHVHRLATRELQHERHVLQQHPRRLALLYETKDLADQP
jgi:hypothetical protein